MTNVPLTFLARYPSRRLVRTTVTISQDVLEATAAAVRSGAAFSRNELIDRALRTDLWRLENEPIDARIFALRDDPEQAALELEVVSEAEISGWEALLIGEAELEEQS